MTLQNLLKTRQLEAFKPTRTEVAALLRAARRSMEDAHNDKVGLETRFDAAYRAIMNSAMVALWANGYRVPKSVPGHHQLMIQSLVKSLGIEHAEMQMLDVFRVKRNAIDYQGELTDAVSLRNCIEAAANLMNTLDAWLKNNRPDLLD